MDSTSLKARVLAMADAIDPPASTYKRKHAERALALAVMRQTRAATIEECAKNCEWNGCHDCAAAIRALAQAEG